MLCKILNKSYFRWEKSRKVQIMNTRIISRAIEYNLLHITKAFSKKALESRHVLAKILNELNVLDLEQQSRSYNPSIEVLLNLTTASVSYFFASCHESGNERALNGYKLFC